MIGSREPPTKARDLDFPREEEKDPLPRFNYSQGGSSTIVNLKVQKGLLGVGTLGSIELCRYLSGSRRVCSPNRVESARQGLCKSFTSLLGGVVTHNARPACDTSWVANEVPARPNKSELDKDAGISLVRIRCVNLV